MKQYTYSNINKAYEQAMDGHEPLELDNLPDTHGSALAAMSYITNYLDKCTESGGMEPHFDAEEYMEWLQRCLKAMKKHLKKL